MSAAGELWTSFKRHYESFCATNQQRLFYYCFILSSRLCDQRWYRQVMLSVAHCFFFSLENLNQMRTLVPPSHDLVTKSGKTQQQQQKSSLALLCSRSTCEWDRSSLHSPQWLSHKLSSVLVSLILWLCLRIPLVLYRTKEQWWKPCRVNLCIWGSLMVWLLSHIQSHSQATPSAVCFNIVKHYCKSVFQGLSVDTLRTVCCEWKLMIHWCFIEGSVVIWSS